MELFGGAGLVPAVRLQGSDDVLPHGRGAAEGVIRHFPNHADHMPLRFKCDQTDAQCRSFRPLRVQTAKR